MSQSNTVRHLELVGRRPAAKLPQYLFKRGHTYYFKRKIPAGAAEAFPDYKEQVTLQQWQGLECTTGPRRRAASVARTPRTRGIRTCYKLPR